MAGTIVLNRFEIGERLGAGGYGTVYRAWDRRLEREVAVKVIATGPASGPRIQREAKAAARLNHPGIVALFEFVHHEYGRDGGRAFLVSELVDGETVRELIDRDGMSDREIADLGADVCEALDHAHSRGVVHRDIKPANLIAPFDGNGAKLMDFGIARLLEADDLTATGDVLGTLAYMAPEQAGGEAVGPPGDLYSLALTLYEAWSGVNPRRFPTPAETLRALERPPPELSRLRPDLPVAVTDMIDACLDPEPEYRPTVEDLGRVLEASLPELSNRRAAPTPDAPGPTALLTEPAGVVPALAMGASAAAVVVASGHADPLSAGLALVFVAAIAAVGPRLGFLLGSVGLAAWLAFIAGLPGAALALAVVTFPPAVLIRGDARVLALIGAGPLLGLVGLAPLTALLAAVAAEWRDRAVIAAAALGATAMTGVAAGRSLLPGELPVADPGWSESLTGAFTGLVVPALTAPAFWLALPVWILVAVVAGAAIHRYRRFRESRGPEDSRLAAVGSGSGITRIDPFEHELLP